MKTFLLKAKHFIKRNIYPITVSLCTVLVLTIVAVSAYSSIKNSNQIVETNQTEIQGGDSEENNDNVNDDSNKPDEGDEDSEPTAADPVIFDLPFDGATISKEYAETSLLYDETTGFWCTHQAVDFACNDGQEVRAVYDGKITKIESSMMNGTVVYLQISDELVVVYKGLSSDLQVSEGDTVSKGQTIGTISGLLSEKADGVHLHLEVYLNNNLVDPNDYFSFDK